MILKKYMYMRTVVWLWRRAAARHDAAPRLKTGDLNDQMTQR